MIKSFNHKGLKEFFLTGNTKGIQSEHINKLRTILSTLNSAVSVDDISKFPTFKLHPLKGTMKGLWAITVNGNWRITFKFEDENVYIVDYMDYH